MREKLSKHIAFVLALILALSSLILLPVAAQEDSYFAFDHLADENGGEYHPDGAQLSLTFSAGATFTASGLFFVSQESNALYLSFTNRSNATKIQISYTYELEGTIHTEVLEGDIAAGVSVQNLTLPTAHIGDSVQDLKIAFSSSEALSGSLVLNAFFDISTYVATAENEATLTRCHYSEETNELQLQGSLSYAATVRYEGETLALFALSEGEDLHLFGKTPIAKTDISFHFSFVVSLSRQDELFKRYVVAAITAAGERIPLCTPTYPSLPTVPITDEKGFKGYHSKDFSDVVDNVPDVGVVDVYLDRLFGTQSEGILYAGEYDYYYFDQAYIEELERNVKNLAGLGSAVYLRLLIGNSRDNLSFADDAPMGVINRLAVLRSEKAQRDLFAAVDFLSARLHQQGKIGGLILGRSADLVSKYSYCSTKSLAQYSAYYAASLNLIAGAARQNIPELRVFLPLSDNIWAKSVTSVKESANFFAELFLPSLLTALETQILEPQSFGIMLESTAFSDRVGSGDSTHLGIDRLPAFLADLEHIALDHKYLHTSVLFSWQPDGTVEAAKLHAEYLLKYAVLSQNSRVSTFLLDFTDAQERGVESGASAIHYLAKYINTDRGAEAAQLALATLGVTSLDQLDAKAQEWMEKRIYRAEITRNGYAEPANVKGSFALWSFSSADNTLGWYEGTACQSFFISSTHQENYALVAHFSDGAGYGELAYHFNSPTDLSFAPLFVMPISINGKDGARYEIQLRFIGENAVTYASAVIEEGENEQFYLDLSASPDSLSAVRAIRLMARPLDGENEEYELHFGGMTIQSESFDDEELSARVSAIRENKSEDDANTLALDYKMPLMITVIIVVVSVMICVVFVLNHKRKNSTKKKGES